jgi:hypothetical protein
MGCAGPPAILIQTTVLRPVSQPRLLATKIGGEWALRSEQALPAMGCAAAPGDPEPNGDPDGSHRRVHPDRRTAGSHKVEPRPGSQPIGSSESAHPTPRRCKNLRLTIESSTRFRFATDLLALWIAIPTKAARRSYSTRPLALPSASRRAPRPTQHTQTFDFPCGTAHCAAGVTGINFAHFTQRPLAVPHGTAQPA